MIARVWRAVATVESAARYVAYFAAELQPQLEAMDGFRHGQIMTRPMTEREADRIELVVITNWKDMDTIARFAGAHINVAVVEPEALAMLLEADVTVRHYEVAFER
jgi:heme-degrading monooxygenase HmoA